VRKRVRLLRETAGAPLRRRRRRPERQEVQTPIHLRRDSADRLHGVRIKAASQRSRPASTMPHESLAAQVGRISGKTTSCQGSLRRPDQAAGVCAHNADFGKGLKAVSQEAEAARPFSFGQARQRLCGERCNSSRQCGQAVKAVGSSCRARLASDCGFRSSKPEAVGKPSQADGKAAAGSRAGWTRPPGCNPYEGATPEETAKAVAEAAASEVLRQAEASRVRVAATNDRPNKKAERPCLDGSTVLGEKRERFRISFKSQSRSCESRRGGRVRPTAWADPPSPFVEAQRVKP
jgi:hypothetical protein